MKRVLITGADGFIGKNLQLHLTERHDVQVLGFTRQQQLSELPTLLQGVDFVFHLAGINRPQNPQEFTSGNAGWSSPCTCSGTLANPSLISLIAR